MGITSFSGVDKSGVGVSVVTSPGEIYSMIQGIVDQKMAEKSVSQGSHAYYRPKAHQEVSGSFVSSTGPGI